jgi:hypothetical protein
MLIIQPVFNLIIDILPRDPQGWLRSNKLLSGTTPYKLVGDFVSKYPGMSKDPVQPHSMLGKDIIQEWYRLVSWYSYECQCRGSVKQLHIPL